MITKIKFGVGLLETITVALYESPIILFREYVQNSLDAYNRAIDVENKKEINNFGANIITDKENKKIIITDNGYAINPDKFREKMTNISISEKDEDRKYIGFRGIGRISGLPFCERLIFRSKFEDVNYVDVCTWNGAEYKTLIKNKSKDSLEQRIDDILIFSKEDYDKKQEDHFFEVIIDQYDLEIEDLISTELFEERLKKLLPLNYLSSFTQSKIIIEHYKIFMNEDLNRFIIPVKYNGNELFKNYTDKYILESGICFWELREQKKDNKLGESIGLIWFSFDRQLKVQRDSEYFGILTRSKNMLMGSNDTFAKVANESAVYFTSYGEMVQALRGVYGELLINNSNLRDNARRDWFRYDEYSRFLNYIIHDFIKILHNYRYKSSKYFRKKASKGKDDREEYKKALRELINLDEDKFDYEGFLRKELDEKYKVTEKGKAQEEKEETYAEQDIPSESVTFQKYYNKIMNIILDFFKKIDQENLFLKLRAYIINKLKVKEINK